MPPSKGADWSCCTHPAPGPGGASVATKRPNVALPRRIRPRRSPPAPDSLPSTAMDTGSDTAVRLERRKLLIASRVVAVGNALPLCAKSSDPVALPLMPKPGDAMFNIARSKSLNRACKAVCPPKRPARSTRPCGSTSVAGSSRYPSPSTRMIAGRAKRNGMLLALPSSATA